MPVRAAALAALLTGRSLPDVMRWSIARRDRALFDFRAQMFGERVEAVTSCPDCAEQLEMQLALAQIAPAKTAARKSEFRTMRSGRHACSLPCCRTAKTCWPFQRRATWPKRAAQLIARCIQTDDPELRERAAALLTGHLRTTCSWT